MSNSKQDIQINGVALSEIFADYALVSKQLIETKFGDMSCGEFSLTEVTHEDGVYVLAEAERLAQLGLTPANAFKRVSLREGMHSNLFLYDDQPIEPELADIGNKYVAVDQYYKTKVEQGSILKQKSQFVPVIIKKEALNNLSRKEETIFRASSLMSKVKLDGGKEVYVRKYEPKF